MSAAETYLRELRRTLPLGYRRRLVAEMRAHFESAVAAETEQGIGKDEAERLTVERLGPARALADQLLADVRSGALGPTARLSAALTTRLAVCVVLLAVAIIGAGAVVVGNRSASPPPAPKVWRLPASPVVHNGVTVRRLILTLQGNIKGASKPHSPTPLTGVIWLQGHQALRERYGYAHPAGVVPVEVLRLSQTR